METILFCFDYTYVKYDKNFMMQKSKGIFHQDWIWRDVQPTRPQESYTYHKLFVLYIGLEIFCFIFLVPKCVNVKFKTRGEYWKRIYNNYILLIFFKCHDDNKNNNIFYVVKNQIKLELNIANKLCTLLVPMRIFRIFFKNF